MQPGHAIRPTDPSHDTATPAGATTGDDQGVRAAATNPPAQPTIWVGPLLIAGLAVLLRVWAPGPTTITPDEPLWLDRADVFASAIADGDFDRASPRLFDAVATMPGVTTMAAGVLGRNLARVGDAFGISGPVEGRSSESPQVLRWSRAVMAVSVSLGLLAFAYLAASLVGRRAALVGLGLLAVEPFLVGHTATLHTDALVTTLGAISILALMGALWAPPRSRGRIPVSPHALGVVTSAVAGSLAVLTKLTAIGVVGGGLALVVVIDLIARRRGRSRRPLDDALRLHAVTALAWAGLAIGVFVVLWPAMWTSPMTQIDHMRESSDLSGQEISLFFWGEPVIGPGVGFLPVNIAFRMSPWLMVAGLVSIGVTIRHLIRPIAGSPRRAVMAALLLAPLPYLVVVGRATKLYDRYALPLWPFLALLVGVSVDLAVRRLATEDRTRLVASAGAVALLVGALATASLAPYGTAFANPIVGGHATAEDAIPLGYGEGIERLGQTIEARERGRCDETIVSVRYDFRVAVPCGVLVQSTADPYEFGDPDYVVRVAGDHQVPIRDRREQLIGQHGVLVDTVQIGGVTYAELWDLRPGASPR